MKTECIIYISPALLEDFEPDCYQQLIDAASLEGIAGPVVAMPDIHTGYGLPIGGILPMDAQRGLVSAGAVGMDINCGVRLLRTNILRQDVNVDQLRNIMIAIEKRIPLGVGKTSPLKSELTPIIDSVLKKGARALVEIGYGRWSDLEMSEEEGCFSNADPKAVSRKAMSRSDQLGTLGSGNHFIEIGYVEEIFNAQAAKTMGLEIDTLTIMIHSGSRGFGHQICIDYSALMAQRAEKNKVEFPTKGLAAAPILSDDGQNYLKAMACAGNFAFANRQLMTYQVREAIGSAFNEVPHRLDLTLVYDVAHNIAKFETHGRKKLLIHRKGATRALPPLHPQNPALYNRIGQPAIIPGSMGTGSYVVVATEEIDETFHSVNHGAGRVLSRTKAKKEIDKKDFTDQMSNVISNVRDYRRIVDEAPSAYKDIDEVINTLATIGLTKKVCRLKPLVSIKG